MTHDRTSGAGGTSKKRLGTYGTWAAVIIGVFAVLYLATKPVVKVR